MPISIACPRCNWKGRVKDELAGRKGKCPTCAELIPIPLKGSPPPVPAGAKAAVDDEPDVLDDADIVEEPKAKSKSAVRPAAGPKGRRDEDEDDPPRRRRDDDEDDRPARSRRRDEEDEDDRLSKARRRPADEDDDDRPSKARRRDVDNDDEDDRPRKKRRVADYDDYDDEDDRPRKKRRGGTVRRNRGGNSGKKIGTIISGVVCLVIGLGLFALGIVLGRTNFWGIGLTVVGIISIIQGVAQPSGSADDD
jgi:hypothetical protein